MELQWPLILFTLFLCLAGGILFFQSLLAYKGKGASTNLTAIVTALISLVIGGICVFFHLQHWERIFNGFGHITSGITLEFIAIVIFGVASIIMIIQAARNHDKVLPRWCAWMGMIVSVLLVVVMSASYLMPSRPIWNTFALPVFYLANMLVFGVFAMLIIAAVRKAEDEITLLKKHLLWVTIVGIAAFILYTVAMCAVSGAFDNVGYFYDPTDSTVVIEDLSNIASIIFAGFGAIYYWLALLLGGVAPLVLALLYRKERSKIIVGASAGLICAVAGGVLFRCLLYVLGFSVTNFF